MNLQSNLVLNAFYLTIILIVARHARRRANDILGYSIFSYMLHITAVLVLFDILSRFEGHPDTVYATINQAGNLLMFLAYPVLPSMWLLYVHCQVHQDTTVLTKARVPLGAILLANAGLVLAARPSGWLYSISAENIYVRGPGYWVPVAVTTAFLAAAAGIIFFNRKAIEPRHFHALILFALPPAIAIILQLAIYGIPMMLGGVTISLLIAYLDIQKQDIDTDYLTGVGNRRHFERHLRRRIDRVASDGRFAAIMLDLDCFKQINDTLGHQAGDEALETVARLLRSSLRARDFVARYGGDEFYVILEGVDSQASLDKIVAKIHAAVRRHNDAGTSLYRIEFSMGYALYEPESGMDMDHFLLHVDQLMYEEKRRRQSSGTVTLLKPAY